MSDTTHQAYREAQRRLTSWGRTLDPEQAATAVPALPGWTVKDTFAHLTGNVADALDRGMVAPPNDGETARQVAERAARSLDEVIDEWEARADAFEQVLAALGDRAPRAVVLDVWTHEIDMRSALGLPIPDGGAAERILAQIARRGIGRGWQPDQVAPLRIITEHDDWVAGASAVGDRPAGTLRITSFELGRVLLGRRSRSQMAALAWEGADPAPWIAALPVFGPTEVDVVDSPRG